MHKSNQIGTHTRIINLLGDSISIQSKSRK